MSSQTVEIPPSYLALRETVRDMQLRGRVTRLAGIKPVLQRRVPGFDERREGFSTFKEFCEAAAAHGAIRVFIDSDGFPSAEVKDVSRDLYQEPSRLRRDIWRAFTQWGDGWIRCWDRATSRVVRLSESPRPNETGDHAAIRTALVAGDGSVVRIQPIGRDDQADWMVQFVATLDDHPLSRPLTAALEDPHPFRAFSVVLNADPVVRRRFNHMRLAKVLEVVRAWAAANTVDLDAIDHSAEPPRDANRSRGSQEDRRSDEDVLRRAVAQAATEMSLEELRRLSIPIGYVLDALR